MKLSPVPPGPKGHFLVGSLPEIQRDELDFLMRQVHEHGDVVTCVSSIITLTSSATLATLKPSWSARAATSSSRFSCAKAKRFLATAC